MDDDAVLKKNTDCVYFLASPLTCKKGNDCEFRHSESARVNPRDCRYWLSGSCLSWDCPFRHPPLEGRPTVALPGGAQGGANKSRVPCYFFSQGFCAKGDKCPYMHASPSIATMKTAAAAPQKPAKAAAAATPPSAPESIEKKSDIPAANGGEARPAQGPTPETQSPTEVKPAPVAGVQSNQKEARTVSVSGAAQNGGPRGRAEGPVVNSGIVGSRLRLRQVQPGDDRVQNGMEPDEWWEESSPGFDVLVDDGPEQSRYPDDPDFQSAGETGLDPTGKVAGGNRGRGGRPMRMADDMEPYDYDFPNPYDSIYEGGSPYNHGGYEYGMHDQEGGYDHPNAYDLPGGHHRASPYPDMGGHMPMDMDLHSGGGPHEHRTRIVKRRRVDGVQQHVPDSHLRRQRTEMSMEDNYRRQRQQEDQQKQLELNLRQQLFMQHGMRNNSRRVNEKTGLEQGVIARRALTDIGTEGGPGPMPERVSMKGTAKSRSSNEQARMGPKENDVHGRLSKGLDAYVEAERRNVMDAEASRKTDKDPRKEPNSFAGPKSLAQIRAEKQKGSVDEVSKQKASNGLKGSGQSGALPKVHAIRSEPQQAPATAVPDVSLESLSVEERKTKPSKVDMKKVPSFEGPKSLTAILREKRRLESEVDPKLEEETNGDRSQTLSSRVVVVSRVDIVSDVDSHVPEDGTEGAGVGYTEVEDGEVLFDDARKDHNNPESRYHHSEAEVDQSHVAARGRLRQDDIAAVSPEAVPENEKEDLQDDERKKEESVEPNEGSSVDYMDGQDYGEEGREGYRVSEPDEDRFDLDDEDDEEDDFAKKLGGFFS